jgi:small-conductance mechanosensitive channel
MLVIGGIAGLTYLVNGRLLAFFEDRPHQKFRRQVIQMSGLLLAVLLAILLLPFSDEIRGDLLGLFGLVVSAAIALSSTTLVGNVMAGIMLKTIGSCSPGDYITVGGHFGRISEMDLLHTEIQTEQRDLTTLPNLYLVTNPVRVMRTSGTVLSVDLSLGYEVSRHEVERLLIEAATAAGLESPYVQIRELGDFSVTYSVSGLLTEVNKLLAKRRELRGRTIDVLHAAGIEIVSPTFMNTRAYPTDETFISKVSAEEKVATPRTSPDALVFDKAEKAESVTRLREKLSEQQAQLKKRDEIMASTSKAETKEAAIKERESIEQKIARLKMLIEKKEAKISDG